MFVSFDSSPAAIGLLSLVCFVRGVFQINFNAVAVKINGMNDARDEISELMSHDSFNRCWWAFGPLCITHKTLTHIYRALGFFIVALCTFFSHARIGIEIWTIISTAQQHRPEILIKIICKRINNDNKTKREKNRNFCKFSASVVEFIETITLSVNSRLRRLQYHNVYSMCSTLKRFINWLFRIISYKLLLL